MSEHIPTDAPETIPAERTRPGIGFQRVNLIDREGRYLRQVRHYGTEAQARAFALLQITHDTQPGFPAILVALRGK